MRRTLRFSLSAIAMVLLAECTAAPRSSSPRLPRRDRSPAEVRLGVPDRLGAAGTYTCAYFSSGHAACWGAILEPWSSAWTLPADGERAVVWPRPRLFEPKAWSDRSGVDDGAAARRAAPRVVTSAWASCTREAGVVGCNPEIVIGPRVQFPDARDATDFALVETRAQRRSQRYLCGRRASDVVCWNFDGGTQRVASDATRSFGGGRLCVQSTDGTLRCSSELAAPSDEIVLEPVGVFSPIVRGGAQSRLVCVQTTEAVECVHYVQARRDYPEELDGWVGGVNGVTREDRQPAFRVTGLVEPIDLAVGDEHACALLADRSVWCWGSTRNGRMGDGTGVGARWITTPVRVDLPAEVVQY